MFSPALLRHALKHKEPATAEAWWPSTASASSMTGQVKAIYLTEIPTWLDGTVDQSSMDKLAQNDWITAGQIMIGSLSAALTLRHRLAKVTVTITSSKTVNEVRFLSYTPNKIDYNYTSTHYVGITPLFSRPLKTVLSIGIQ